MASIEQHASGWRLCGGGLVLDIDRRTGSLGALSLVDGQGFQWSQHPGDVVVRDDLLRKTFDTRDLDQVQYEVAGESLVAKKIFRGVPWSLTERYHVGPDTLHWEAEVSLDAGDFRSCAVGYQIPWPQPLYPMKFWAARENMPSAPHRFAQICFEYGEVTSGILIPALCCYRDDKDAGLLLVMPFDFRTPRLRFVSAFRDPDLRVEFDWLALARGGSAKTSLLLRACGGNWRPALGWLYQRFKEYFEPRSHTIDRLWGGHVCGRCNVSLEQALAMKDLGLTWHEIHEHFPAYGNYHPEGVNEWPLGDHVPDEMLDALGRPPGPTVVSVDMIRRTIANLHKAGCAAMPYIQVSGEGDEQLLDPAFEDSAVTDLHGQRYSGWPGTHTMNSDPSLSFGRDVARQIAGMVTRYPEIDGVFLDQACYNFVDTAHHDGLTAIDNRACYMTGFNYYPHLEHLSSLLHPEKVIIGNGPHCVGILKYIDGCMAEGVDWLCDHLQYYGLAKPIFFLKYKTDDASIESMFLRCLKYAAGYSSYAPAAASKDLYALYRPLLERLFRRRWVFDPDPLNLPEGFDGGLYRSRGGSLLASIAGKESRLEGRPARTQGVCIRTADTAGVRRVTLQQPGSEVQEVAFTIDDDAVQFDIPSQTVAAVAELHVEP